MPPWPRSCKGVNCTGRDCICLDFDWDVIGGADLFRSQQDTQGYDEFAPDFAKQVNLILLLLLSQLLRRNVRKKIYEKKKNAKKYEKKNGKMNEEKKI